MWKLLKAELEYNGIFRIVINGLVLFAAVMNSIRGNEEKVMAILMLLLRLVSGQLRRVRRIITGGRALLSHSKKFDTQGMNQGAALFDFSRRKSKADNTGLHRFEIIRSTGQKIDHTFPRTGRITSQFIGIVKSLRIRMA
jgi:hypothetical protein